MVLPDDWELLASKLIEWGICKVIKESEVLDRFY